MAVTEESAELRDHGSFAHQLIDWYQKNQRDLPWRSSGDPYLIWLSEIMLQQTRVDQMTPYYLKFIHRFPDVQTLAASDIHDVLVAWEGLGYYSRARNLHKAAQQVVNSFGGKIPDSLDDIITLKGVGDYTAAAVLSIAYGKPYAVVDGNVMRVIARYLGIDEDIRSSRVKKQIQEIVSAWIPSESPSDFNQGMMELGSQICKPRNPLCESCPLAAYCVAAQTARTDVIPYKSKAAKVPHHTIVAGIIRDADGRVLIAQRPESAMLGGLWEFPGGKLEKGESLQEALERELQEELGVRIHPPVAFHTLKHAYSHFKITLHAFICSISSGIPQPKTSDALKWVDVHELSDYPFPKANRQLTRKLQQELI